jgi:hypothetical protein
VIQVTTNRETVAKMSLMNAIQSAFARCEASLSTTCCSRRPDQQPKIPDQRAIIELSNLATSQDLDEQQNSIDEISSVVAHSSGARCSWK